MSHEPVKPFDNFQYTKNQPTNAAISDVKDRISDMASNVKDKAGHVVDTVSETMGHQRENAADGLGRAASAIHDNAESAPGGPKVVKMAKDVMDICRRYPTQSLVAALAVGFLIGRSRR